MTSECRLETKYRLSQVSVGRSLSDSAGPDPRSVETVKDYCGASSAFYDFHVVSKIDPLLNPHHTWFYVAVTDWTPQSPMVLCGKNSTLSASQADDVDEIPITRFI
jgi:hypothetical protein